MLAEVIDQIQLQARGDFTRDIGSIGSKKWSAIRSYYLSVEDAILKRNGDCYGIDPYVIDWLSVFTPIESMAWSCIRNYGLPLYPQFPVGRVFVDFGDPVKRIALECDGKAYHDEAKDYERDAMLSEMGWIVFRSKGWECNRPDFELSSVLEEINADPDDLGDSEELIRKQLETSVDGLVRAIGHRFYGKRFHSLAEKHLAGVLASHTWTRLP